MTDLTCNTLVIGAGPGGYVCAIRAGQLGVDTIIVEAENPGGTCLNVGCIPSKALIHASEIFHQAKVNNEGSEIGIKAGKPRIQLKKTMAWKDEIVERLTGGVRALLKKNKVRYIAGWARIIDGKTVEVETDDGVIRVHTRHIVIATGSKSVELPNLPFQGKVISSSEALSLPSVPERLAVVGGGYIGLELGTVFAKLGSEVTIVEAEERVLPIYDHALTGPVEKSLSSLGVKVSNNTKAIGLSEDGENLLLDKGDDEHESVPVDKVLVTVGRRPLLEGWGLENVYVDLEDGFIKISDRCETSTDSIYAIGDVTGEPMLAHRAMAQGEMVAEIIAGHRRQWDKVAVPAICFTDPEIVIAGLSSIEAEALGHDVTESVFPFAANGRAMTVQNEVGFVRIVARKDNNLILGLQAVGHGVSELAAGFSLALEMGARVEDIAHTVHAHPSLGEALQESALRSLGHALHI